MRDDAAISTPENGAFHGGVHLLAKAVTGLAFVTVLLGGLTKSKEAGLTIAEPVTFAWMPEWLTTANINAEYSHRIVAFTLACTMAALLAWVLVKENRRAVRKLAIWAMALVVVQAALGALTVAFFARASTSIPHAVLAQVFLCLAASLAIVTSRNWLSPVAQVQEESQPGLRRLAVTAVIMLFVQLLLGAALRHDNKGAVLRSGHEHIFVTHLLAHFLGALGVLFFSGRLMSRVFRAHRQIKELMTPLRVVMILLAFQLTLGIGAGILKFSTSATYEGANAPPDLRVYVATAHQAIGALLLLLSVVIALYAYRFTPRRLAASESHISSALGASA